MQNHEWHAPFSPSVSATEINHAHLSLFTWLTNLVADHVHYEIYKLTVKDNEVHLCASTNDQCPEDSVNQTQSGNMGNSRKV
jgi:hypothetical protein